ncbi:hypothetical protein Gotur_003606, partial [Gossypium turneri]
MGGFEIVVGLVDIFQIEARALLEGLKFAWAKGYRRVEIENENDNSISSDMVIDRVAKETLGEIDHLIIHEEPPKSVRGLLDDDTHCITYPLFDGDYKGGTQTRWGLCVEFLWLVCMVKEKMGCVIEEKIKQGALVNEGAESTLLEEMKLLNEMQHQS